MTAARMRERGAATIEHVGVIVLVVAVIGAVILTASPVGQAIAARLCEAVGTTCGAPAPAERTAQDFVPPEQCVVSGDGDKASFSAAVTFVEVGGDESWMIEELSDETFRMTKTSGDTLAATGGVGAGATVTHNQTDSLGAEASIGGSAGSRTGRGESYVVPTRADAQQLLDQRRRDERMDNWFSDDNPVRDGLDWIYERFGGETDLENAEPDEQFDEAGVTVEGKARATGGTVTGGGSAGHTDLEGTKHRKDGTTTDYFQTTYQAAADGSLNEMDPDRGGDKRTYGDASASRKDRYEIDRDEDGNPVALRVVTTTQADANGRHLQDVAESSGSVQEYSEHTMQIPLETASDRGYAARVLNLMDADDVPGISDAPGGADPGGPGAVADLINHDQLMSEIRDVARERGYDWEREYVDSGGDGWTVSAGAKFGAELGVSHSSATVDQATTSYRYWDGSQMVARGECKQ